MNKKALPLLLLAVVLTVAHFACKKADDAKIIAAESSDYFPLKRGSYVVYDVDSTYWDNYYCVTRYYHCQLKYTVADTFTDELGRASYRIDVRIRKKVEEPWETHKVMYATNTGEELELVYDEQRYIKMRYPVQEGLTWKGNAYVNVADSDLHYYNDWDYQYLDVDKTYDNGAVKYDHTVTVLQRDETKNNPEAIPGQDASRTYSKEVFAKGIGMIYREFYHWTYDASAINNNDPNNPNKCRSGAGVVMKAVDHN